MGRRRLAEEGKLRTTVLGLLPKDGSPIRWRELKQGAGQKKLSQSTLSIYLKKFAADGTIKREVDSESHPPRVVYRITQAGQSSLNRDPLVDRIQKSGAVIHDTFRLGDTVVQTSDQLAPKIMVNNWSTEVALLVDKQHAAIAADLFSAIPGAQLGYDFATQVYNAMYRLRNKGKMPETWKEELDRSREAMTIDATIIMRFDGKKLASIQDWDDRLRVAERHMQRIEKEQLEWQELATRDRKTALEAAIACEIKRADTAPVEEIADWVLKYWAESELPTPPTLEEVTGIVDRWIKEGLVETETIVLCQLTDSLTSKYREYLDLAKSARSVAASKSLGRLPHIGDEEWQSTVPKQPST